MCSSSKQVFVSVPIHEPTFSHTKVRTEISLHMGLINKETEFNSAPQYYLPNDDLGLLLICPYHTDSCRYMSFYKTFESIYNLLVSIIPHAQFSVAH